jgi:sirohydrochlorin ferrochelatase
MAAKKADAVVSAPMGPDPRLAEVLAERLSETLPTVADSKTTEDAPVILAVAGSRDPASLTDAEAMASLLSLRLGRRVELAYLAAREPDLPHARSSRRTCSPAASSSTSP